MLVFGVEGGDGKQREVATPKTSNECSFLGLRVVVASRERSTLKMRLCSFSGLGGDGSWWASKGGGGDQREVGW